MEESRLDKASGDEPKRFPVQDSTDKLVWNFSEAACERENALTHNYVEQHHRR